MDVNLMDMIFWLIWNRRNTARVGDEAIEIHQIRKRAVLFLQDFLQVQGRQISYLSRIIEIFVGFLLSNPNSKSILMGLLLISWELPFLVWWCVILREKPLGP